MAKSIKSPLPAAAQPQDADNHAEALHTLVDLAGRKTLPIPAEFLARHVLGLPGQWDWPVRRAAFEALLRRFAQVRTDEVSVLDTPRRGPFGHYTLTRNDTNGALPYDVRLVSLAPMRGTCDCADFVRASLGLCKHLLCVLSHLAKKAGKNERAWENLLKSPPPRRTTSVVFYDATSADQTDPLDALRLEMPRTDRHVATPIVRLFRASPSNSWRLKSTHADDLKARQRLVRMLEQHLRSARASADPAARVVLAQESARLIRVLHLRSRARQLNHAVTAGKRRLYKYQQQGVSRFLADGRLVLADDMGLGKTTQAITAASAMYATGIIKRGLFIVPAALKSQWEREWRNVSAAPLLVIDGGSDGRRSSYESTQRGFLITNYEQVVRDLDAIQAWGPQLVVLDEAQRIKNWATRTAQTIKQLKPEFRLVLTGTPMENRLEELASIVEWVDDRALEPKWRLAPWHSTFADGTREIVGARNLDTLRARLDPILLRRLRTEVLTQLPKRQDSVIPVDLSEEQREAHAELSMPIAKLASIARRRSLLPAEFLRLMSLMLTQRVIANGMAQLNFEATWPTISQRVATAKLVESLASPKLLEFRELIANLALLQKRKVVVFSQFRRMLQLSAWAVSDVLAPAGLRTLFFTGQESPKRRTQNLVDFHDDKRAAVLFLTDAGGVGLNLQNAASACINLDLPWNPAVLEQRIGRIHRLGQKFPIDVYNLVSRNSIEERIAALVSDKRALFKGLFDGDTNELKFERSGSLLQLLEQISPVNAPESPQPVEAPVDGNNTGSEAEVETLIAAASDADRVAGGMPSTIDASNTPDIANLFGSVAIARNPDGSMTINAPPQAARALSALFAGMAQMLGAVAP